MSSLSKHWGTLEGVKKSIEASSCCEWEHGNDQGTHQILNIKKKISLMTTTSKIRGKNFRIPLSLLHLISFLLPFFLTKT